QAAGGLRERRKASEQARSAFDQAVAEASAKDRALRKVAADRSLPPAGVDGVAAAVDRFDKLAIKLAGVRERSDAAHEKAEQERERLDRAHDEEQSATAEADRAHVTWTTESERLRTQQDRLGADAAQVLADIAAAEAQIKAAQTARTEATKARERAIRDHAAAGTEAEAAIAALRTAIAEEQAEARRLEPFADPDLLAILRCPTTLTWPARHEDWPDPAGDAAGMALPPAVAAIHDGILAATRDLSPTEASVKQATTRLTKALDDLSTELSAAGHDYRPEWESAGGLIVVRIADEHGLAPVGAFGERIAGARRDQEQLLTESERRVLEDALLTQLARQIHERTVDARDLINRMNTEMRRRRMSSGLTVGVRWELADSLADEQRDIVRLMERDAASLGPDELARMRAYFAGSIKAARAARPDRGYRQILADVLDYRRWRSFSFFLHPPGGGEERLTRARHGQLSGGEQSVSLHLPLFAAAHVTFNSADPRCPRLLALDEAFAGVDDKGRTELFGLTTEFDFDLFMTGFDLWATYDTVPGAAHYDLKHSPAEHAVSALLMVWDGTGTDADVDGSLAAALGSPLTRRRPARGSGLLDDLEPADA
ncbi:MAG TPA: SbcC/MukB-like Walker B domain-containing protein, partial [Pseudonocardiaceae bacterium]|nr:SbcC/MukB-like Walker B domain-containing protein [Pseudonocardiaceae bacterium]